MSSRSLIPRALGNLLFSFTISRLNSEPQPPAEGVKVASEVPTETESGEKAVYNGDPYPLDRQGKPLNSEGSYFMIHDALTLAELQSNWNEGETNGGLLGTAKFGEWVHNCPFSGTCLDNTGKSLADPASTGQARKIRGNWGLYLIAEQQVWCERQADPEQGLGVFMRFAGAPANAHLLNLYLEGGLSYTGLFPYRNHDAVGLAVVYGRISRGVRTLAADKNFYTDSRDPSPDFEQAFEATYRALICPALAVQPIIGYVAHPGGAPGNDALVLGVRATLDF